MLIQVAASDQHAEVLLERVATGPGQLDRYTDGDATHARAQEHHDAQCDDQQRMQVCRFTLLVHSAEQFRHQAGRVEGRGRLGKDADLHAVLVEAATVFEVAPWLPPMPTVLLAVAQQDLVQLLDLVLGERDVLPGREHQFHQLRLDGVAGLFTPPPSTLPLCFTSSSAVYFSSSWTKRSPQ